MNAPKRLPRVLVAAFFESVGRDAQGRPLLGGLVDTTVVPGIAGITKMPTALYLDVRGVALGPHSLVMRFHDPSGKALAGMFREEVVVAGDTHGYKFTGLTWLDLPASAHAGIYELRVRWDDELLAAVPLRLEVDPAPKSPSTPATSH